MFHKLIAILLAGTFISTASSCAPSNVGASNEEASSAEGPKDIRESPSDRGALHTRREFAVGKDGRPLIVPIVWDGDSFEFVLDTGATKTGFDVSLKSRLGDAVGKITSQTSAELAEFEVFACPNATVGGHALKGIETVFCADLQPLRYAVGKDIRGILGADFLRQFKVTIDFDNGRVQLDTSTTNETAPGDTSIPMTLDKWGRPHIMARIGGTKHQSLLIDTGAMDDTLRSDLFDALVETGMIATGTYQIGSTVGGIFVQRSGYVSTIDLEDFRVLGVRVARHSESSIGLDVLSRFHISLDFPNRKCVLRKGSRFDVPFSRATSGLAVIQMEGRKVIVNVRPDSPASKANLWPGDEIVAVDSQPTAELEMFALGQKLISAVGDEVELAIQRGSATFSVHLRLQDRLSNEARITRGGGAFNPSTRN